MLLYLAVRFGSNAELPEKVVWNHELNDDCFDQTIKGEYKKEPQSGYAGYVRDVQLKSLFISIFCPSIVLFAESRLFAITSFTSTAYYLFALVAGWMLMKVDSNFSYTPALTNGATICNVTNGTHITASLPSNFGEDITTWLFPVCFALLVISAGFQWMLWFLSDHMNLHRYTCGLFMHPSLIAEAVDKLAKNESEMEWNSRLDFQRDIQSHYRYIKLLVIYSRCLIKLQCS